ncbi:MAG: radical SAM family heme chaperone HemW [Bacteroidota bacterium]
MAGIYIHIPFCKRKCHYCNFFSLASQKGRAPFLNALKKEIAATRNYLSGEPVNTIYFGGGTPSLYRPGELQEVMEEIASPPDPSPRGEGRIFPSAIREGSVLSEVTLELNPEDVTEEYVAELKKTWFNRFSLGVQSFLDEDLVYLNRSHSAGQALQAVKLLQWAGYENISIDLIYGIPSSTPARWEKNLETAFSLGITHISAYALTIEPRTPLAWMIGNQKSAPVSDESQVEQFKMLMKKTKEQEFLQYEISNFCKPGRHALHNTNYWKGIPYLGLGPSAHSFNGSSRRWNISNLSEYITVTEKGGCLFEEEELTNIQKYNEYVMTSLRTMWGFNLEKINDELQVTNDELIRKQALTFVQQGWLTEKSGVYFLTDDGKLFADRIASDLFLTEDEV